MKVTVVHYPPKSNGVYARVWRANGEWSDVDVRMVEGEKYEDIIPAIHKAYPEWSAIEITICLVK